MACLFWMPPVLEARGSWEQGGSRPLWGQSCSTWTRVLCLLAEVTRPWIWSLFPLPSSAPRPDLPLPRRDPCCLKCLLSLYLTACCFSCAKAPAPGFPSVQCSLSGVSPQCLPLPQCGRGPAPAVCVGEQRLCRAMGSQGSGLAPGAVSLQELCSCRSLYRQSRGSQCFRRSQGADLACRALRWVCQVEGVALGEGQAGGFRLSLKWLVFASQLGGPSAFL